MLFLNLYKNKKNGELFEEYLPESTKYEKFVKDAHHVLYTVPGLTFSTEAFPLYTKVPKLLYKRYKIDKKHLTDNGLLIAKMYNIKYNEGDKFDYLLFYDLVNVMNSPLTLHPLAPITYMPYPCSGSMKFYHSEKLDEEDISEFIDEVFRINDYVVSKRIVIDLADFSHKSYEDEFITKTTIQKAKEKLIESENILMLSIVTGVKM